MIHWLRERLAKDEAGFTLIELMVVVLIIAILIAIAIPTFLGARERAQDRGAQSNLRNALSAEKVHYTDDEAYTATVADLQAIEPSIQWVTAAPAVGEVQVEISADPFQVVCLTALSGGGTTFYLADVATGGAPGTYYSATAPAACTEAGVSGWSTTGW